MLVWESQFLQNVRTRLPTVDPHVTAEDWLEQFTQGLNRVRFETCSHKHDDDTPVGIRAILGHCSRPRANPGVPHAHGRITAFVRDRHFFKLPAVLRQDMHVTSHPRIFRTARHHLLRKVGNHRPFLKYITSSIATRFLKLTWSKDKALVYNYSKHSVMLLLILEMFQQTAMQESFDTIKRFCTKDNQKSHRTHTGNPSRCPCKSKQRRLDLITICAHSFEKALHRNKLEEELLQNQANMYGRECTVDLCSDQGNSDVTELMVIDETTQCENCWEHSAHGMSFCTGGVILQEPSAQKANTLKETTSHVMIRLSGLQWQTSPAVLEYHDAKHHFRKAIYNLDVCPDGWNKDED